jgi:hypothetical protein
MNSLNISGSGAGQGRGEARKEIIEEPIFSLMDVSFSSDLYQAREQGC